MGLFSFNKKTRTAAIEKNDNLTFKGEEFLTDDVDILKKMYDYYINLYFRNHQKEHKDIAIIILMKAHNIFKNQTPYNPFNWAREKYVIFVEDYEEYASYEYDKFIKELKECYLPSHSYKKKIKDLFPWDVCKCDYKYNIGRTFLYHNDQELTTDMKKDNAIVEYFEKNIVGIIDAIDELLQNEIASHSILHTAYYMYLDLFMYIYNSDEHFSFSIWNKTNKYLKYAQSVYVFNSGKKDKYHLDENELARYDEEAINCLKNWSKEKLLRAYKDNKDYNNVLLPIINQNPKVFYNDNSLEEIINNILELDTTIMINYDKKAKIGNFLYDCFHYSDDLYLIHSCMYFIKKLKVNKVYYQDSSEFKLTQILDKIINKYDLEEI